MGKLLRFLIVILTFCVVLTSVALSGELEEDLIDAIYYQQVEVVRYLINKGANVNARVYFENGESESMLNYAIDVGIDVCWDDDECWDKAEEIILMLEAAGAR